MAASSTGLTIGAMVPEAPQFSMREGLDGAGDIHRPVLHVERDAINALAGDDARNQWIGNADPACEKARTTPHALRQGGEGWIGHEFPPETPDSPSGKTQPRRGRAGRGFVLD